MCEMESTEAVKEVCISTPDSCYVISLAPGSKSHPGSWSCGIN